MRKFYGIYHRYGYDIYEADTDGTPICTGGNSPWESTAVVSVKDGAGLRRIKKWCNITGEDVARENNGVFIGSERDVERESDFAEFLERKVA